VIATKHVGPAIAASQPPVPTKRTVRAPSSASAMSTLNASPPAIKTQTFVRFSASRMASIRSLCGSGGGLRAAALRSSAIRLITRYGLPRNRLASIANAINSVGMTWDAVV
jgi:hypothetical protein